MSSLKAVPMFREFFYNGNCLPDSDPSLSVDQVRDLFGPMHPEIATASVTGPEEKGSVVRYTFARAIGSKAKPCRRPKRRTSFLRYSL